MLSDDEYTDDEDSDDEDSDASPSPPWRLEAAARWASLSHRLLVRQDIRNKHYTLKHKGQDVFKHYTLKTYGRLLQALKHHTHPLSTMDRMSYLKGPPY